MELRQQYRECYRLERMRGHVVHLQSYVDDFTPADDKTDNLILHFEWLINQYPPEVVHAAQESKRQAARGFSGWLHSSGAYVLRNALYMKRIKASREELLRGLDAQME